MGKPFWARFRLRRLRIDAVDQSEPPENWVRPHSSWQFPGKKHTLKPHGFVWKLGTLNWNWSIDYHYYFHENGHLQGTSPFSDNPAFWMVRSSNHTLICYIPQCVFPSAEASPVNQTITFLNFRWGKWEILGACTLRIMMDARFNLYAQSLIQLCAKDWMGDFLWGGFPLMFMASLPRH